MMRCNEPLHLSSPAADALPADHVRLAASAYLARFTGSSREHTQSDLHCYLRWCADRGLDPDVDGAPGPGSGPPSTLVPPTRLKPDASTRIPAGTMIRVPPTSDTVVGGVRIQRSGPRGDRGPRGDWRAEVAEAEYAAFASKKGQAARR